ncbi:DUF6122 family protein [Costertonia aggregata]|uniref:Metal-dependent hydrolase n=1 Tax=Costertonia aggregata TaxID=343403 RepID=A0A7H9ALE1_9FLAO|nr:DUF6122 family protein [Costertonia aggregata]QLG44085.1 hypothetical protein HYG79_01550 [Costertonia aggregata]
MLRFFLHYGIHFLVPVLIAFVFFKENRFRILCILWAGILIDIDHLLASPIFDADRCSINFHPLHSYWAMAVYIFLTIIKKTRIVGIALLIHILADVTDCLLID